MSTQKPTTLLIDLGHQSSRLAFLHNDKKFCWFDRSINSCWPLGSHFWVSEDRKEILLGKSGSSATSSVTRHGFVYFRSLPELLENSTWIRVGNSKYPLQKVIQYLFTFFCEQLSDRGIQSVERVIFLSPNSCSDFFVNQIQEALLHFDWGEINFHSYSKSLVKSFFHQSEPVFAESQPERAHPGYTMTLNMGSSSFEASLFYHSDDREVHLLTTFTNESLNGRSFHQPIIEKICEESGLKIEDMSDDSLFEKLAERCKRDLSRGVFTKIASPESSAELVDDHVSPRSEMELRRDDFRIAWSHCAQQVKSMLCHLANTQNMELSHFENMIFYGGNLNSPCLRQLLKNEFSTATFYPDSHHFIVPEGVEIYPSDEFSLPFGLGLALDGQDIFTFFKPMVVLPGLFKTKVTTSFRGQSAISLALFAGNSQVSSENFFIGAFDFFGIPERACHGGDPLINLIADINREGSLRITLASKGASKSETFIINLPGLIEYLKGMDLYDEVCRASGGDPAAFDRSAARRQRYKNAMKILRLAEEFMFQGSEALGLSQKLVLEHSMMMLESALAAEDSEMVDRFMIELGRQLPRDDSLNPDLF